MKFSVSKSELKHGLSIVAKQASGRTTLPVLKNVLIEAQMGRAKLAATDLQIGVATYINADVSEEGSVTLPSDRLIGLVDAMPDKEVTVSCSNGSDAKLSCGSFSGNVKGITAEEFPVIPDGTYSDMTVNGYLWRKMIDAVSFCADTSNTGKIIESVYIASKNGELNAYATNMYRLARCTMQFGLPDFQMSIPAKSLQEVSRLGGDLIGITVNENQVVFSSGDTTMVMQQSSGKYPVFDHGFIELPITSRVDRRELLSAIKGVNVFSQDSNDKIKIASTGNEISVYAVSAQMGDANPKVDAISTEEFEIHMNGQYLQAVLNAIPDNEVVLHLKDGRTQMMITGAEDNESKYLIIPMMVK